MKNSCFIAAAGLLTAAFAGCASIERTSPGVMDGLNVKGGAQPATQTVCVRNFGFGFVYLFTAICGDLDYDKSTQDIKGGCLLFSDKCNCFDCYNTLQTVANEEGKRLTNINMVNNSLPSQGITSYPQLLGWLIEFEDVSCSGVLRTK